MRSQSDFRRHPKCARFFFRQNTASIENIRLILLFFYPYFRFGGLNKKCDDRMQLLEEAFGIAKEYHDKFIVLEKWLDKSEKKIKDMEVVPTEEDQIQRRIQEHDKLHTEILGKQPSFDDVADVASALMQVVSEEVKNNLQNIFSFLYSKFRQNFNSFFSFLGCPRCC